MGETCPSGCVDEKLVCMGRVRLRICKTAIEDTVGSSGAFSNYLFWRNLFNYTPMRLSHRLKMITDWPHEYGTSGKIRLSVKLSKCVAGIAAYMLQ